MTIHKKLMMIVSCLAIGSWVDASVAPVSGSLSQYSAPYAAKAMPAWSNSGLGGQNMQMPQATLDSEVLGSVAQGQQFQQPFLNQKIHVRPEIKNSYQKTQQKTETQQKMKKDYSLYAEPKSTLEAAKILDVSENASEKEILSAYRKAAINAHPDLGGSDAAMKVVNKAKDLLQSRAKYVQNRAQHTKAQDQARAEEATRREYEKARAQQARTQEASQREYSKKSQEPSKAKQQSTKKSQASRFTRGQKAGAAGAVAGGATGLGLNYYFNNKQKNSQRIFDRENLEDALVDSIAQEIEKQKLIQAIEQEIEDRILIEQAEDAAIQKLQEKADAKLYRQFAPRSYYVPNKNLWLSDSEMARSLYNKFN
jgi:curved DNA-binding protein CbpA